MVFISMMFFCRIVILVTICSVVVYSCVMSYIYFICFEYFLFSNFNRLMFIIVLQTKGYIRMVIPHTSHVY